jgi:phage terminase large subunit GpA-like protein
MGEAAQVDYDSCEVDSKEAEALLRFDLRRMRNTVRRIDFEKNTLTLPEWAEQKRILPDGTPFPGKWKNKRTPYMVKIGVACSPQSPTEVITLVKAGQLGGTAGTAENLIGYTVDVEPCPLLYVTASRDLAIKWSEDRIGPMLELCGADKKLRGTTNKKGARSTGNKVLSKNFPGGSMLFASYGQVALMRTNSFQKIIFDEVDKAEDTSEGDARKLGEVRTTAYEGRRKIILVSTPLEEMTSRIWRAFQEGTMEFYHVPCPHCDEMTRLDLLDEDLRCRLEFDFADDAKKIVDESSVGIPCYECGALIRNEHKRRMFGDPRCDWVPTNPSPLPRNESFFIDAAYAPPGMVSFRTLAQEWVNAEGDEEAMKIFVTLRGGRPYKESLDMPSDDQVKSKVGGYKRGTVPKGPLLVTCGGDLHKDRLDVEIVGFNGRESWSLDWLHYHGKPTFGEGGSLRKFADDFNNRKLPGDPKIGFVDARYEQDEVVKMAASIPDLFAVMGEEWIGSGAPFAKSELKQYDGMEYIRVNTGLMKTRLMNSLKLEPYDGGLAFPDGFPHFPDDYEDLYFDQLNSEVKKAILDPKTSRVKRYQWIEKHSKGNHALDCRGYAMAACEYQIYRLALEVGLEADYIEFIWDCLRNPENVDLLLQ